MIYNVVSQIYRCLALHLTFYDAWHHSNSFENKSFKTQHSLSSDENATLRRSAALNRWRSYIKKKLITHALHHDAPLHQCTKL